MIDILGDGNIPVTTLDKNSGFVVAERSSISLRTKEDAALALWWADCGKLAG